MALVLLEGRIRALRNTGIFGVTIQTSNNVGHKPNNTLLIVIEKRQYYTISESQMLKESE